MVIEKILLFKDAPIREEDRGKHLTVSEWTELKEERGMRQLKSRLLGLCGREVVKSDKEIADILVELGGVRSEDEGKVKVYSLCGREVPYDNFNNYLRFDRIVDAHGFGEKIRVRKVHIDLD